MINQNVLKDNRVLCKMPVVSQQNGVVPSLIRREGKRQRYVEAVMESGSRKVQNFLMRIKWIFSWIENINSSDDLQLQRLLFMTAKSISRI